MCCSSLSLHLLVTVQLKYIFSLFWVGALEALPLCGAVFQSEGAKQLKCVAQSQKSCPEHEFCVTHQLRSGGRDWAMFASGWKRRHTAACQRGGGYAHVPGGTLPLPQQPQWEPPGCAPASQADARARLSWRWHPPGPIKRNDPGNPKTPFLPPNSGQPSKG